MDEKIRYSIRSVMAQYSRSQDDLGAGWMGDASDPKLKKSENMTKHGNDRPLSTVELRFNELLYNEVLGIRNDILQFSNSKMCGKCNEPISPVPWHFVKSRSSTVTRRKHSTNDPNLFLSLKSMSTQTDRHSPLARKSNFYDEQKRYKSNCVSTRLDLRRCYTRQFFLQLVPQFCCAVARQAVLAGNVA